MNRKRWQRFALVKEAPATDWQATRTRHGVAGYPRTIYPRAGFTLLEVIVSVGLLVMLAGFAFGFLWNLWVQRDRAEEWAAWSSGAATLLERIERDMLGVIAGDDVVGAGIAGDAARLRVLTRGVAVMDADSRGALPDVIGCEYTYDEVAGMLRMRRWRPGGSGGEGGGESDVVLTRVEKFRVRFFDGRGWVDSFDSLTAGRLPAAVEIAMWRGDPPPPEPTDAVAPERETSGGSDSSTASGVDELTASNRLVDPPLNQAWDTQPWRVRPPDRLRIIVAPDGPSAGWRDER